MLKKMFAVILILSLMVSASAAAASEAAAAGEAVYEVLYPRPEDLSGLSLVPEYTGAGEKPDEAILPEPEQAGEPEIRTDVMDRLSGVWKLESGGALAGEYLILSGGGTFTSAMWNWDLDAPEEPEASGTWYVTETGPSVNLYWNNPPYQLTLLRDDGQEKNLGLVFDDSGFSLSDEEGLGEIGRAHV